MNAVRTMITAAAVLGLSLVAAVSEAAPVVYPFNSGNGLMGVESVIGRVSTYLPRDGETFFDIARRFSLGYNELVLANPDVDPWLPAVGQHIIIPSEWILPDGRYHGLVMNIPEMRLYYYPSDSRSTVLTFPVGLGRQDWQTPRAEFRVRGKTKNPTWVIPESIRKERFEENGSTETRIPGGVPHNPLGKYRLELTLPAYAIHGTNKDFGIGMQVSHGCVRMYPEHIESLFPLVDVGSAGIFLYQPVKVGVSNGRVLVEVHEDIYSVSPWPWQLANDLLQRRGLLPYVDRELLEAALEASTGVPTDIGVVGTLQPSANF